MSQGLLPYAVEVVEGADTVTGRAGLPLVLETLRALGLDQVIAEQVQVRERQSGYTEAEKIEALILLLAAGGTCLDDIRVLQADGGLRRLLGRRLPSADRLRHFLYACHNDQLIAQAQAQRPPDRVAYIPAENAALQGLGRVNTALVHRVAAQGRSTTATLDHDATIQESHKREALPHYQGGRGYQPTAVYWVEQDLVVADEYRDGNVGAGMETLPLICRAFASLPPTVTTLYFRADTACYDDRTLKWLQDPERPGGPRGPIGFTVGADMTQDLHEVCAAVPPCGRFGANAAWYRLSLLTSNVLSALKSLALPPALSAARPKRLRFTVFTLAGRIVSHAGRVWLRLSAAAERLAGVIAARQRLARLAQALPAG